MHRSGWNVWRDSLWHFNHSPLAVSLQPQPQVTLVKATGVNMISRIQKQTRLLTCGLFCWQVLTLIRAWISSDTDGLITHPYPNFNSGLTHWGRVTHICVGNLTIIGSYNGLSPERRQAIIWTNAGILLIGPLGTNFSEFFIAIHTFSFNKTHLKMSSAKWRPFVSASMC